MTPWQHEAACVDLTWLADVDDRDGPPAQRHLVEAVADARVVCAPCPVRAECLADALVTDRGGTGMRGGLTPAERAPLEAKGQRRSAGRWASGRRLTVEVRERIHTLAREGRAARDIAAAVGVSVWVVVDVSRETRPPTASEARAVALAGEGRSVRAIASEAGVSKSVAHRAVLKAAPPPPSVPQPRAVPNGVRPILAAPPRPGVVSPTRGGTGSDPRTPRPR